MPELFVDRSHESGRLWPRRAIGALALLCDAGGHRVALVEPAYHTRGLILIGGAVEEGEDPRRALSREIDEETRLQREAGRLLVTEYVNAEPGRGKPDGLNLVFDVEPLGPGEWESVILARAELKEKRLVPLADVETCTEGLLARRIKTAMRARAAGTHEYLSPPE
ncbi:NUDIX domain-containing protein [Streptomyces sp. CMB-StM0423]|uniref:NUDIX domain-containing protein n=1 Tax=Streptomyces sp. CMB-StM0423 TaxID=2059884 RepID=UPI000C706C4E|nr:NUDIX domain-containing protein [Streptomyces sp. CMB-StM0423]AUH41642.1 NUDIX hydrolase [Streptomyces sp. CMB-StM0423]